MVDKTLYTDKSIESLTPLEFTRLRPGVYAGSTVYSTQTVIEIESNSLDEARLGHGDKIEITIREDNSIAVRDYGQGFIYSMREDGKSILEAAFSVMNTSGKYSDDGVYEGTALGLNGIGSKLTNFLSHWCNVTSYRDGFFETVEFIEGVYNNRKTGKIDLPSGTLVEWMPSEEFFEHIEPDVKELKKLFEAHVCLVPGLTIVLDNRGEKTVFQAKNGLHDLVDTAVGSNEILKNRFFTSFEDGKNKLDLILTYSTNHSLTIVPYVNIGLTEAGPHIVQIKTLMTREFNKFFREKGYLKEKDENLTGDDIQDGMFLVFNITAPGVSYDAQTKSRVVKIDMAPFTGILAENLRFWLAANEKDIKQIAERALLARKAREAAKKAREAVRGGAAKDKKKKFVKFDSKLADCYGTDRTKCEIYITEGDSASGNLKDARNNEFQAVLPVRGKILNTQKATLDKIQKNAEIMSMCQAFGLEVDPKTLKMTYKPENLRYGKIIIMSDADVDGAHIKNLFYTFIWNFCPQLIIDGYVYAGYPPLYKVTIAKKYVYLKNDAALDEFRASHQGRNYVVKRLKGLGEMDKKDTEETLIDPENRIIKQVTVEDIPLADKLFDNLMGTDITARKNFITEHAQEATYVI